MPKKNHITSPYDITIIGAGPAGTSAALALRNSGLKVLLIDKATFPRDKICGDAIPGPSFKFLKEIAPELEQHFFQFNKMEFVKSSKIVTQSGKSMTFDWVLKAFNSKRIDFDTQLLDLVKDHSPTQVLEGHQVLNIERNDRGFTLHLKDQQIHTKMLIGADGANGICAKKLLDFQLDRNHHCAAVRAYFKNVQLEEGVNEFYLLKNYLPGYFWIFPLPNGWANVGFGMVSKEISNRKINLTKSLAQIIESEPHLKEKFYNAEQVGKTLGFGLPLGSRKARLSGAGFLLCGDAGSLIDPLQGHGIDKAIFSGKLAAEQAILAFAEHDFSASFLRRYDKKVYKKFGAEFRRNYFLMRFLNKFSWVLDIVFRIRSIVS